MAVMMDPDHTHPVAIASTGTGAGALPSTRELVTSVFKDGRKILTTMAVVFGLMFLIALLTPPRYAATSSLLIMLGPEYTYRPAAGEMSAVNASFEREAILQTEINVLHSRPLLEEVLRTVGLEKVFPERVHPGIVSVILGGIGKGLHAIKAAITGGDSGEEPDPVKLALDDFGDMYGIEAERVGDVIRVSFTHKDPDVAAEVLNTTIHSFIERRRELFADPQSTLVEDQVAKLRDQASQAQGNLQAYKAAHDISNYETQLDILLHRRGEVAKDQQDAENLVSQLTQKVAALQVQQKIVPVDVMVYTETNSGERTKNIQDSLENMRAREIELQANYRPDSRPVQEIRLQIDKMEAELQRLRSDQSASATRKGRNLVYDNVVFELSKAQSDLSAAQARATLDKDQLADVDRQVQALNERRTDLLALERQSMAAEEGLKDAIKIYQDRKLMEDVAARKGANVRVIQDAEAPMKSTGIRKMIVIVGFVLALVAGAIVAVVSEFNRRGFLSPEKLERTLGIPVLVSIPDSRALRHGTAPPALTE